MTLPSGGTPRMEVLGLSKSLLTLRISRLVVNNTSKCSAAANKNLERPLTFGSWGVWQFQRRLELHQHKAGWAWWEAQPNASLAVEKRQRYSSRNATESAWTLKSITRWSLFRYLVGVHVHEAEALGSGGFALDQANVSFIQICKRIQSLQDGLDGGGGLHIFNDHSWTKTDRFYVNPYYIWTPG